MSAGITPRMHNVKRKVFISFHQKDRNEVDKFIELWADYHDIFISKALGVSDNDDFIDSTNPEYVMSQIRDKYLQDSTVTIVLIGSCTHSRRYVDWEIKASLRQAKNDVTNGLIGILIPSQGNRAHLPPRFKDNWNKENNCYARYYSAPKSDDELRRWIEDAYTARINRAQLINNPQDMMKYNQECKVCGITH